MLEVGCYETVRYDVKLEGSPMRCFYTEEKALAFIQEHKERFEYMCKVELACIHDVV